VTGHHQSTEQPSISTRPTPVQPLAPNPPEQRFPLDAISVGPDVSPRLEILGHQMDIPHGGADLRVAEHTGESHHFPARSQIVDGEGVPQAMPAEPRKAELVLPKVEAA